MPVTKPLELDKIELPPEPGLFGGWGRKLELTLLRFALSVFNKVMGPLWAARDKAAKYLFQGIEDELKPVIEPLLDTIDENPNVPVWIKGMTKHLRFSEPITFALIVSALIVAAIVGLVMGLVGPVIRVISQETDSYVHSARMTPSEAFAALRRGEIGEKEFHNHLSDGGWSEELEDVWKAILAPLLEVGDLGRLFMREEIGEGEFNTELGKRGYREPEIDKIKTLLHVIPPLTDIISMAVREAFTPAMVERFQLHAELPGEMVSWAKKQGLSENWARAYWAAHWQLPPMTMGFEMLHRGEIDEAEMQMLIKAHDVSPFWRDKLLAISHTPYTRVDVRRMYNAGVLKAEGVYKSYREGGYDHEKATNMTNLAIALKGGAERDLTKSEVLYGYEHRMFSSGETDGLLFDLGYDQIEADYYKAKVDYKLWQKMVKEIVKTTGQQYIANQIDQTGVYAKLGELNLPADQMNEYIRGWDIKKEAKTKRLTAERLVKFRTQEVIDDGDFTSEMSGLGYSQRYIGWFLDSIGKGKG